MHYLATLSRLIRSTRTFPSVDKLNYMTGPGSREMQNKIGKMQGMTIESLKRHYDLIPIMFLIGLAIVYPVLYTGRLALKATDVTWKKELQPYEDYAAREYKFLNPSGNKLAAAPSPRPNYEN